MFVSADGLDGLCRSASTVDLKFEADAKIKVSAARLELDSRSSHIKMRHMSCTKLIVP